MSVPEAFWLFLQQKGNKHWKKLYVRRSLCPTYCNSFYEQNAKTISNEAGATCVCVCVWGQTLERRKAQTEHYHKLSFSIIHFLHQNHWCFQLYIYLTQVHQAVCTKPVFKPLQQCVQLCTWNIDSFLSCSLDIADTVKTSRCAQRT